MQVEDHPVSYFDFEGIIPSGNYGAGTVMVWDVGTWEPEGDAHAMLAKGDFKFRLDGDKLKGSFALIHIRSRKPGNKGTEWLLIKHRDAYVQEPYDIDAYDYSVLTKRTLDQIADDAGVREWKSSRPAATGGQSKKNDWLADSIAKADAAKRKAPAKSATSAASKPAKATTTKTKAASAKIANGRCRQEEERLRSSAVKKKSPPKKRLSR